MERIQNLTKKQLLRVAKSLISYQRYSVYDSHQIEDSVALTLALEQSACFLGLDDIEEDSSVVIGMFVSAIIKAVADSSDSEIDFPRKEWQFLTTFLPTPFEGES